MAVATNSKIAYKALKDLGKRQMQVYWQVKTMEAQGKRPSNTDIADILGLPINSVTGRVKELKDYGYLRVHGKKLGKYGTPVDTLCTANPHDKKLIEIFEAEKEQDDEWQPSAISWLND